MTHSRAAIPGATEALVRRVTFRKAGLAPWDKRVEQTWLYTLARSAQATQVDVNHTVLVLSHHHTTVTTGHTPVRHFLNRLHHPMSRAMNTLLECRGFDAFGTFWDGRQPHRMRLLDAAAQMSQLVYQQVQLVAAGMVDKPEDMPGWTFRWDMWRPGRFLRCHRPDIYFDPRFAPEYADLRFVPPPLLMELFHGDVEKLIYWMKRLEQEAICVLREKRRKEGRRVRGPRFATAIHPWDEPRTSAGKGGVPIPTFRLGARGLVGRKLRIRCCREVSAWRQANRSCVTAWNEGEHRVVFPYGTDKMCDTHQVRVAEAPDPDALVYAPGPSLQEILNRYGHRRHTQLPEEAHCVTEEVRQALIDEAPLFSDVFEARFDKTSRSVLKSSQPASPKKGLNTQNELDSRGVAQQPQTSGDVVVQTLQGRRSVSRIHPPRRIIVHRHRSPPEEQDAERRATDPPSD